MGKRPFIIISLVALGAIIITIAYRVFFWPIFSEFRQGQGIKDNAAASPAATDKKEEVKEPRSEAEMLGLAAKYEKEGNLLKAREMYQRFIEKYPTSRGISAIQESLGRLNIGILFSPVIDDSSFFYEIQKGDTLAKIAKKHSQTVELLTKVNSLQGASIKYGRRLKIPKAKFSIVVDKSQNILTLNADGNVLKTYRVATGLNNSTPVATFTIVNKIQNPTWYTANAVIPAGSPQNILGSRWMGFSKKGYGIHGTTEPESIGKSVTAGCVRMANADVEELYTIIPVGTEVVIVD